MKELMEGRGRITMGELRMAAWGALLVAACSAGEAPGAGADAGPGEDASTWEPEIAEPAPPEPPAPPSYGG